MLTLVFTPALLSARVWVTTYVLWIARFLLRNRRFKAWTGCTRLGLEENGRKTKPEIIWDYAEPPLLEKKSQPV